MRRQFKSLCFAVLVIGASAAPASAQFFNFMMDLISTGARYNRVEPGGAVSGSVVGFEDFKQELWQEASAAGISQATFERALAGMTPDPWVVEKATHQPEYVKPVWEYLAGAVSEQRVELGRQALANHSAVLGAIENTFGVDRYVLVAIWGMESTYGRILTDTTLVKPIVRSLASLAYLDPKRRKFATAQLIAALSIIQEEGLEPGLVVGSWAGAMGHTQFIPTTYQSHAVDFDGDGRRDLWTSVADALASSANYLSRSGWNSGETWGYEVALPPGFDYALSGRTMSIADWGSMGVRRTHERAFPRPGDRASLFLPAGAEGPAFLLLENFNVIKRYNSSDAYALAVGHLSDRLRGGDTFASSWPVNERALGRDERAELQQLLEARGFDTGGVDGKIGPKTEQAIRAYQASVGLVPDGFASGSILDRLRGSS